MSTATIVSLRVGLPKRIDEDDVWISSIFKDPVEHPLMLRGVNLEGDEQADLRVHGGPDKAVCVYSFDHYPRWREDSRFATMDAGAFGENLSVTGSHEATVCIGDVYNVGEAVVEVAQPRSPCWKVAKRWQSDVLPKLVVETGRTGWYLRVLAEGLVAVGQQLTLTDRPYPQWSISRVNEAMYTRSSRTDLEELAVCPALAESWRAPLARKLEHRRRR